MEYLETHLGQKVVLETDNNGPVYHGEIVDFVAGTQLVKVKWDGDGVFGLVSPSQLQIEND